jgi:Notch-like protein
LISLKFYKLFEVLCAPIDSSSCGDWNEYKNEKCIKILDKEKLVIFDEAQKSCLQADNESSILTIHSKEEQEFISEFVFKTNKVIENVWIGLKNSNNQFKWTDGSEIGFTNWAKGNPSNKTDHNCVQMISDSSPIGQWADEFCDKKHIIVCQKKPTLTMTSLQNQIIEISKQLSQTQKQLNETRNTWSTYLKFITNDKWINFKLFTDSDGKYKALFFHINKTITYAETTWDEAKKTCESLNASLVEIQTIEKQFILESFLGQFRIESNELYYIWLNGHRESSGKWKWITSGKEFTYTNWGSENPKTNSSRDYIYISFYGHDTFGKWYNYPATEHHHVLCEIEVNF